MSILGDAQNSAGQPAPGQPALADAALSREVD